MKLLKVKLHEKCQLVAVADDKEVILTASRATKTPRQRATFYIPCCAIWDC